MFIYCREKVYESRLKLYELEAEYEQGDFFRASKSTILNIAKIKSVSPVPYGKLEALLQNGDVFNENDQFLTALANHVSRFRIYFL
ncbi:LytTr DNA-binding domain protein [compost metagenome]